MDGKSLRGVAYSRTSSRHTGKGSSLQDVNNQHPTTVRVSGSIVKAKNLIKPSSTGQSTLRLHSSSIDHQNSFPSRVRRSLMQKKHAVERVIGTKKTNIPKCTRKQLETSDTKAILKTAIFPELRSYLAGKDPPEHEHLLENKKQIRHKPGCGSLYAPTISFTQRLIASRDAKEVVKKSSLVVRGDRVDTNNCNLKSNNSQIIKVNPSVCSQFISVSSKRDTTTISRSFSASSSKKLSRSTNKSSFSTSNISNGSVLLNKSKIHDHLVMFKPQDHSNRETPRVHQSREILGSSSESVVIPSSSSSLNSDSFSVRKNFTRSDTFDGPTSSSNQGRTLRLKDSSSNADAHKHNNSRVAQHILEAFLFYGNWNYHVDQHRELRMDIDDMSYEELLELQEKMGSVCTGLTDEMLTKCLKRCNFKPASSLSRISYFVEDFNTCSVCQEEYSVGEEIGRLACKHSYHVRCIQQWLRQKNWCPVCKAPASDDSQPMANGH